MIIQRNEVKVAQELVAVAKELQALGIGQDMAADPDAVGKLADKLLSRLGPAKSHPLRTYGIVDLRPTDTVEQLARAWATVLLAQ
jgi:hypothetical protein